HYYKICFSPSNCHDFFFFLFLKKIQCFFQSENELTSREFLSVFTSGGLAPSLGIINSTYTGIFHFNLTLFSDRVYWLIDIPRENITKNTDIAAVEEWLVRITLQHGLNIYNTEGTLLDRVREPILQWKLGTMMTRNNISKVYPHVVDLKVTKCPCANDVALLGFIMDSTLDGVYIGLSFSGFWNYNDTTWYNLTDMIYSQVGEEHTELSVVDMVLANHFLVILTSLGLFISGDLRYPSSSVLLVDYIKGKLWYNERCFANRERFEVDYITITFERNRTLSEASSCFYSKEPFLEWLPCLPSISKRMKSIPSTVITFLIDQEQSSGIYLFQNQKNTTASVRIFRNNRPRLRQKFPLFSFPSSFSSPVGMVFHPRSHFLYAYGNQVWLSVDGGNTFELLADFHDDIIKNVYHSFYTSDITFVSQSGKVYSTKAGLGRYTEIGSISDQIFTLYYDHMGFIHKLTPDHFEASGSFGAFGNSKGIFGQAPDMGFETALAPQHITLNEMIFFAYVPENEPQGSIYTKKFNEIHFGKVIRSRKTGTAYIREILYHDTPKGFLSSVIAEMIDPFGIEAVHESSCLSSSLSINQAGNFFYKLSLQLQSKYNNTSLMAGKNEKLSFGKNLISQDNCLLRYWGRTSTYEFGVDTIQPVAVTLNNLHLLGFFQGSTSLAFIVWGASTECFVTTIVPTLKSSCSYLKSMHHIPSEFIPLEDWNSGVHMDSQGFNMIKVLPVNYRPPSNMGIAIPLTDNFYHADPSQPIPRNLFHKSKKSGKFKQCANASTREECNCTNNQKFSYAVGFSDCREKVPRFKFPVTQYPISLKIYNEDGYIPVETPYLVTVAEVNNRENWKLKQSVPENVKKLKDYLGLILHAPVYNPLGLNLSVKGSELFHFRVSVVPGVTFCNLVEEFQIYVDEAPLPFPGHTLIAVAAAVVLGGLIFIAFMFQIHNSHPYQQLSKTDSVNLGVSAT
uniref:Cation channel sperm associated auxiliary subunit beta n=1 Tax=Sus scrofa TaxID=9823 RepID=A0A8D0MQ49_PIG